MSARTRNAPDRPAPPWFADGLCFECQPDCGACCKNHEDYSYVYLVGDDLERLVAHVGVAAEEFRRRYTETDDGQVVLRMDRPECPFLDGTRCTVYEARPTQCRTFPFWSETLRSPKSWRKLREFCPGIDRGTRHPLHVIEDELRRRDRGE